MSDLVERLEAEAVWCDRFTADDGLTTFGAIAAEWRESAAMLREAAAELSRISALVAEWQKAGAEAEAQMMALYISVSPHATYERDGKIGNRFADEDHAIAGLRRLSQLKDTTNADK